MEFQVKTSQKTEVIDITEQIESKIDKNSDICTIFVPHTTAGLTVNENENGLLKDLKDFLQEAVPDGEYRHDKIDDNATSHLRSLLLDSDITVPIKNSSLQLGTWQSILFIELDGPRTRKIKLKLQD